MGASLGAKRRRSHGEGSIYYDESRQRWVGQAWLEGRRRKVTARTKAEVSARLGRLLHGDPAERHVDRRQTVAGLLADWQAKSLAAKTLAPSTREAHQWAASRWVDELGSVKLDRLDVVAVEKALGRMAAGGKDQRPLSKASLVKARSTLRQALAWAERRRVVSHNAAAVAELPHGANGAGTRRALSADELARLLDALDGHPMGPMFRCMARVGLRPGEAAGLCADALDLDADPPTVAVVRAVQLRRGRPALVDDLKTSGSRRTLAIPDDVRQALADPLAAAGDGLLFRAPGGGPLWPSTARTELVAACQAAGVEPVTPNELRHSCATLLADSGLPPHHVADILGHRSTRMVDAVYRHRPAVIRGAEGYSSAGHHDGRR